MRKEFTIESVTQTLVGVLAEVQEASGYSLPTISGEVCPIGDLEPFDSLMGVEATVLLEQRLGIELREETVFVDGTRALSIAEIAERIAEPKTPRS